MADLTISGHRRGLEFQAQARVSGSPSQPHHQLATISVQLGGTRDAKRDDQGRGGVAEEGIGFIHTNRSD